MDMEIYTDENMYRLFSNKLVAQLHRVYAECRDNARSDKEIELAIKFLNFYTTQCTMRPACDNQS
ncbi:MAG: hypothetical protein Q7W05_04890 [Deltaproteobacteria bacterium]|nr:hypothetical protein [Deltaproteobacteria bacterium]